MITAVGSRESSEFRRQNGLLAGHWPHCLCETLEVADATISRYSSTWLGPTVCCSRLSRGLPRAENYAACRALRITRLAAR
jgi:hypothetical protein